MASIDPPPIPADLILRHVWFSIGDRVEILDLDGTLRFMNEVSVRALRPALLHDIEGQPWLDRKGT